MAEIERAFEEEMEVERQRRDQLANHAETRSRARQITRTERAGRARFLVLAVALATTVVVVTIVMFEALAWLVG
jgi:hypothetical protein